MFSVLTLGIAQLLTLLLLSILVLVAILFSALLSSGKKKIIQSDTDDTETRDHSPELWREEQAREYIQRQERERQEREYYQQQRQHAEQERREAQLAYERKKRDDWEESQRIRPIYEKYPQIYRFEILYWRAVSKPWWWNNYAKELVEYAQDYFPQNKVNYFALYNSNSKGQDYNTPSLQRRIQALRPRKLSKHPLVIINYDEEFLMIDTYYALQEMMDRIDAEWYRHFRFKKTYRASPTTYKK